MTPNSASNSRFDALINAARQPSKDILDKESNGRSISDSPSPSTKKKSKSSDPNYVRTTVYLPKTLHQQLKMAAYEEGREMSEVMEQLVFEWIEGRNHQ